MNIILLGPPGAGKGTQATMLARALKVPHISTGLMLRDAVSAGSDLGKQVDSIMAAGDLVPDDLVVALVDERLDQDDAQCGYLLDGWLATTPLFVVLGALAGAAGGFLHFLAHVAPDMLPFGRRKPSDDDPPRSN